MGPAHAERNAQRIPMLPYPRLGNRRPLRVDGPDGVLVAGERVHSLSADIECTRYPQNAGVPFGRTGIILSTLEDARIKQMLGELRETSSKRQLQIYNEGHYRNVSVQDEQEAI
jgi:hypothetical protein